jgi:hypothetical protein
MTRAKEAEIRGILDRVDQFRFGFWLIEILGPVTKAV